MVCPPPWRDTAHQRVTRHGKPRPRLTARTPHIRDVLRRAHLSANAGLKGPASSHYLKPNSHFRGQIGEKRCAVDRTSP